MKPSDQFGSKGEPQPIIIGDGAKQPSLVLNGQPQPVIHQRQSQVTSLVTNETAPTNVSSEG